MSASIHENDWKVFRQLRPVALERFCQRALSEIAQVASDTSKTSHDRYLAIYKLVQSRDDELADAFNDFRRSTAALQLAHILSHELLTDEEMTQFSPEIRDLVQLLLRI